MAAAVGCDRRRVRVTSIGSSRDLEAVARVSGVFSLLLLLVSSRQCCCKPEPSVKPAEGECGGESNQGLSCSDRQY